MQKVCSLVDTIDTLCINTLGKAFCWEVRQGQYKQRVLANFFLVEKLFLAQESIKKAINRKLYKGQIATEWQNHFVRFRVAGS